MPTISVQIDAAEKLALRSQALALLADMSDWLVAHENDDGDDYFARAKLCNQMIRQLKDWESQTLQIVTTDHQAGAAVDGINRATDALTQAQARIDNIGAQIDVFAGFLDLMGAIAGGNPSSIVKSSAAVYKAAMAVKPV
ncbi:hypothetical protein SAMN02745857_02781 [Andreprevotia lacus DSM 23236]|jgi:hypothetical protein|uniref:Uncharacterized protein n=1 Tax=Andreprevotia lacus DSM 23236 TaxID=1121001 RepID=A0A1W1XTU5_9NEIS|nr:hypothetical protein [Andreprevotia lacus]SMC27275.1 hypothetical protein SAMN02745857_02781 [Andreprevotia lacus DSM 23236]